MLAQGSCELAVIALPCLGTRGGEGRTHRLTSGANFPPRLILWRLWWTIKDGLLSLKTAGGVGGGWKVSVSTVNMRHLPVSINGEAWPERQWRHVMGAQGAARSDAGRTSSRESWLEKDGIEQASVVCRQVETKSSRAARTHTLSLFRWRV